jgi:glycosyltransferase involved in cell wall biosynthesis
MPPTLSVIMPVYNEKDTVREIVQRVRDVDLVHEIIIVDDGSQDGTRDILQELSVLPNIIVVEHAQNQGKGAAVVTGIRNATGELLVVQDADLEYDPKDYAKLIQPLLEGRCDVVYGSRFGDSKIQNANLMNFRIAKSRTIHYITSAF